MSLLLSKDKTKTKSNYKQEKGMLGITERKLEI
jgi:hypothetical protein